MMSESTVCAGLDGADPLGMLATLGTLSIGSRADVVSSLHWERHGRWHPIFATKGGEGALVDAIVESLIGRSASSARERLEELQRATAEASRLLIEAEANIEQAASRDGERAARGVLKDAKDRLKSAKVAVRAQQELTDSLVGQSIAERHPVTRAALHLDDVTKGGLTGEQLRAFASAPSAASYLVGIGADLHVGRTKQTLARTHFSFANNNSGKQLLKDFAGVASLITPSRVRDALFGQGVLRDRITGLGWEPGSQRSYALQFNDPQDEVTCQVAHHALAFVGLGLLPTMPSGRDRATTGFARFPDGSVTPEVVDDDEGGAEARVRMEECWTWPIWSPPLSYAGVTTLLGWTGLAQVTPPEVEMRARGIAAAYRARRIVFEKRSYFSPGRAVA